MNFGFNNTATSPEARFFTADGGMLDIAAERIELFDSVGNLSRLLLLGDITGDTIDASTESAFNGVSILGGGGDDLIIVDENGMGAIDGGDGFDTLRINADSGIGFSTSSGGQQSINSFGGYNNLASIERAETIDQNGNLRSLAQLGTTSDDVIDLTSLTFDNNAFTVLLGNDGNDILTGGGGSFTSLNGGNGDDTLIAGTGDTNFVGGSGADTFITAGAGQYSIGYSASFQAITINLSTSTALGGDAAGDVFNGNEISDIFGGESDDNLTGNDSINEINGFFGDDILIGGEGADSLIGGPGNDIFQIDALSEANGDTIQDFDSGDCLLYTSPSPRDKRQSRMPSSA